jgi:hypothetical protein
MWEAEQACGDGHRLRLRCVADSLCAHLVRAGRNAGDGIPPVVPGHGTEAGSGNRNVGVGKRLACFTGDGSGDAAILRGQRQGDEGETGSQCATLHEHGDQPGDCPRRMRQ